MLDCKNVVVVNNEDGKTYQAVEYVRHCLDFAASDAVETMGKNNKGKPVQVNGVDWKGTKPAGKITASTDVESVANLLQDAMNYFVNKYGETGDFKAVPAETKGYLILLSAADYGEDLWTRAKIQADTRPAKAQDPAEAEKRTIKQMIAEAASRGKVMTEEKAKAMLEKLRAMEAEDEAA